MGRLFCFTIDLEPDFLSDDRHEVLRDDDRMDAVTGFLAANGIRPTVFVAGKMLSGDLPVGERFEPLGAEFALHSYSHRNEEPDSAREIRLGVEAFGEYFGRRPRGYRAPSGIITPGGIARLAAAGFEYDSSVFPAWRPELGYDFRSLPDAPFAFAEHPGLVELPFAVVPKVRIVLSLSFLKLLGWPAYAGMFRTLGMPELLVFDSHLYDFFATSPVTSLSRRDWRRYALLRNQDRVFPLLQRLVDRARDAGYEFALMSEMLDQVAGTGLPAVSAALLGDAA